MKKRLFAMTGVWALAMVGAMLLAPACKAQSEISPDHFDGTESWAAPTQAAHAAKPAPSMAKATLQPQSSAALVTSTAILLACKGPVSRQHRAFSR